MRLNWEEAKVSLELKGGIKLKIIEKRKIFFILSIVFIAIGMIMTAVNGLNYGIDFTGGTLIQIDLERSTELSDVRKIVDRFDRDASIIHAGDEKQEVIIKSSKNISSAESMELFEEFKTEFKLKGSQPLEVQSIGASIGNEIKRNALISIAIASLGMLIYISFRFELKFGVSAVIALIHDALMMVSVYAIFRLSVDSTFIAAILTVIGYSINDTIVVFDRIRENLKKSKRSDSYEDIVDSSINMTIKRSLLTSFTTIVSLIFLYVLGVEAIRNFALPLAIGILVGTYSSIFVASPIWYELKKRTEKTA